MKKSLFFLLVLSAAASLISQERFRKSPPFPDPLQELNLPLVESAVLSNGLRVAVVQRTDSPAVNLRLVVFAGESVSPGNLPGLASFTAQMVGKETSLLSSSDIEEMMESIGGNFSSTTLFDYSLFSLEFLDEYLDDALSVFSRMILDPGFSDREIENVKRTMFYDLLERGKDAEYVAERLLYKLLFHNHPYGRSILTEEAVRNITKKEVLSFYGNTYRPNNSILIVAGNINLSTAARKISHYFNTWEKSEGERAVIPPARPNDKERICFVDLPRERDSTIAVGTIILPALDPDIFPFLVFNQVLGGTPTSRLFMNLRESKGYAYYAFSEVKSHRSNGMFLIKAKVIPPATYSSVQEIMKELENIVHEKLPTFEMEQAKSHLIGNFPLQLERLGDLSLKVSELLAFGLSSEHWNGFYESIMRVDSTRIFDVGQRFPLLKPVIVIIGNKTILGEYLREFDSIEVYDTKGNFQYTITKGVEE